MTLYIDTCVLPRSRMEEASLYRDRFGPGLGFELLPMFDLAPWENNLAQHLAVFRDVPLIFHEPVWGVEHTAPRGSPGWAQSMVHLRLTRKYADLLHPTHMVYHLNNRIIPPEKAKKMLLTSLKNLEEIRAWFPDVRLVLENTGIRAEGTQILDRDEFVRLSRELRWDVLIDVGHANANGWDLYALIEDLRDRIVGFHLHNNDGVHDLHNRIDQGTIDFDRLLPFLAQSVPDAFLVIEYTRPEFHGEPLCEDIRSLLHRYGAGA